MGAQHQISLIENMDTGVYVSNKLLSSLVFFLFFSFQISNAFDASSGELLHLHSNSATLSPSRASKTRFQIEVVLSELL